ncbi:unnamed protein product [Peronospora farinosa]|uniref:Uncharacterized protein n=1 Tax=Peronospora farinosa TaxID=134698 RepID=A0AAV0UKM8_9STRA|nr:unnamed protein product [Peronospora farinosa]
MGHLNKDALANTQSVTTTIPTISFKTKALCSVCLKDKQKVTEFPSHSQSKTSRVLEHVNTDVLGPKRTKSKGGAKYVLTTTRTKMILTMTILSIRRHPNDLVLIKTTCLQKLY